MRGSDQKQDAMFSYVSPEQRVPAEHPLRPLRAIMDDILKEMSPRFAKPYSDTRRPSILPERLSRWMKIIGMLKKVKLRGLEKVSWLSTFVAAIYNLYRSQRLEAQAAT
jgi:hypothetical protein